MKKRHLGAIVVMAWPAALLAADPVPAPNAIAPPANTSPQKPAPDLNRVPALPGLLEVSADGETAYFAGAITTASYGALQKLLDANPRVKRLELASTGGLVLTGRLMGSLVGRRKLAVHVEHLCASACTLILLASPQRTIGPRAQIGFHQSYQLTPHRGKSRSRPSSSSKIRGDLSERPGLSGTALPEPTNMGDQLTRSSLTNAGVDDAFIARALATRSDDMWYPAPAELLASKVISSEQPDSAVAGPSWAISRDALVAALPAPMWQALQAYDADLWGEAIDALWRSRNAGTPADAAYYAARSGVADFLLSDLIRAPDALVARVATIHAYQARVARDDNYAICRPDPFDQRIVTATEKAQIMLEDAALTDLMQLTKWVKPMSSGKAERIFTRFVDRHAELAASMAGDNAVEDSCRGGMKILEAIGALPAEKRSDTYRAMLSLGV